jgi:hypothetical protein
MMRRWLMTGCGLLALALLVGGAWFTRHTNQQERERDELILGLQASKAARHVNAEKPQYEPYFHRFLNAERGLMKVLLYDLSGWEIGRAPGTKPPIPLNETAVRYTTAMLLRPLNGETPLAPYPKKPAGLSAEKRFGNRLFATNVLTGSWIAEIRATTGERWLVATARSSTLIRRSSALL